MTGQEEEQISIDKVSSVRCKSNIPIRSFSTLLVHISQCVPQHAQDLAQLRQGIEQVTDRELEAEKRLEDFIAMSQNQNAQLQSELQELRNLLAVREEQLASAVFRSDNMPT